MPSKQAAPASGRASRIFVMIVLTALFACWDSSKVISHVSYQKMDGVVKVDNSSESSDNNETKHHRDALADKQEEESLNEEECTLPELSSFDNPGEVNSLRRRLGLEKPR